LSVSLRERWRDRERGEEGETERPGQKEMREKEVMVIKYDRAHDRLCSLAYGDII
jgi:hypothetical protein